MVLERIWPRLQPSLEKPHWITLDFSHWEYHKESGEESSEEEREVDPERRERMVLL